METVKTQYLCDAVVETKVVERANSTTEKRPASTDEAKKTVHDDPYFHVDSRVLTAS